MKTENKFAKLAFLVITGALLLSLSTLATAESDAVRAIRASAATVPTNIPGIHTYAEPPKGFNPVTARDVELATYGFPPRPDKRADGAGYALWERAMTRAKIRWNGDLKPALGGGRVMIPAGSSRTQSVGQLQVQPQTGPKQLSNISGSGVSLDNGVKQWNTKTSFINILATMSVPHSQLGDSATGCTASDYFSASLVGLDGEIWYGGNGVPFFLPQENAGVLSAVDCAGEATYYTYLGWENFNTVFQVNPGDVVFTALGANGGGCNSGFVYLTDLTTGTFGSYTITNPCSVPQIGRFANWMVWRPCCDGPGPDGAWPLANTTDVFFGLGETQNAGGKYLYPGSQAASTEILTMMDDAEDQAIETVIQGSYTGTAGLIFETTGCAVGSGCTP
ncbi:MAG: hypothetical protein ABSD75_16540 [Terriglobales bacterium]|jgi:hypothetical protein